MTEVSTILLTLLIEGFLFLLLALSVWIFFAVRKTKRAKTAAAKLVEQIQNQSAKRLKETGSFLEEKYLFEGNELKKAVKSIDKAEKIFMQKVINMYISHDDKAMQSMDATVAEFIDSYKSLKPAIQEVVTEVDGDDNTAAIEDRSEEVENLKAEKEKLKEELAITKETMGNMIAEFGSMFGGGKENDVKAEEIFEKVSEHEGDESSMKTEESSSDNGAQNTSADTVENEPQSADSSNANKIPEEVEAVPVADTEATENEIAIVEEHVKKESVDETETDASISSEVAMDEGIDELLDGIDLSEDVKGI